MDSLGWFFRKFFHKYKLIKKEVKNEKNFMALRASTDTNSGR